jgi:DNA-binding Lrp family transcriptional regulator
MNPYLIMRIDKAQLDSNRHIYAITRHAVRIALHDAGLTYQAIADMEGMIAQRAVPHTTVLYSIIRAKRDRILIREIARVKRRIRDAKTKTTNQVQQ